MGAPKYSIGVSQLVLVVKDPNLPPNAGDTRDAGSTPGGEDPLEEENGNPLQYSCLKNSMEKRSLVDYSPWGCKGWTQLRNWAHTRAHTHTHTPYLSRKEPACNAGDTGEAGSIPGSRRSPGVGNGNPLQYSCQEIPWTQEPGKWDKTETFQGNLYYLTILYFK